MSIARPHLPPPLGLTAMQRLAEAVMRWRRRPPGEQSASPEPTGLSATFARPAEREQGDAEGDQLRVALNAFAHIGGVVPAVLVDADRERLQLLDAVIARVHAAERVVFVTCGHDDPDSRRANHAELLRRLNERPAIAAAPPAPPVDIARRIAAGSAVALCLEIRGLSPSGLVALGQLLHFEPGVVVVEESPADVRGSELEPWAAAG